jgi:hypothetical protein
MEVGSKAVTNETIVFHFSFPTRYGKGMDSEEFGSSDGGDLANNPEVQESDRAL